MIQITDKSNCCGCSACSSVCPQKCISMKKDSEGFLYPSINKTECINCGMCDRICPILNPKRPDDKPEAYAVQLKDIDSLYHSASGGMFTAISNVVSEKNGYVFGAVYDEKFMVKHFGTDDPKQFYRFRSSKYVQSDPGQCYSQVKSLLDKGEYVCYSGTPCQIAGLRSFLKKEYDNLFTVDLVCKGVASPEVLKQYTEMMTKKYGKIVGMNFKRKTYGYHSSTMSIDFAGRKSYSRGGITDYMMRSFRANICMRPSCYQCSFKGESRVSDMTLFDCWHYEQLSGKKDNDKGYTAVMVHTEKGKKMLELCRSFASVEEIDLEKSVKYDGIMINNCTDQHPKREEYMYLLHEKGLESAVKFCIPVGLKEKAMDGSKRVLYKLGVLNFVKRKKGRREIK